MLNLFKRLTILVICLMTFASSTIAGDSDIVNCNKNWRIVVLGSSTAFGTGATTYDSSWVGKYTAYMKRRDAANEVINLAIPGFTTYQNLRPDGYTPPPGRPSPVSGFNITAALAANPDAIIINLPSNDAANDYTLSEQQANFEAALALTDAANIPVWVTTSQPRNQMSTAQIQNLVDLRDWVITRFGDKSVNFWNDVANPDGSIATFYDFDNVHVNNEGHRLFFSRMAAENILDSLCNRFTGTLVARAGNDQSVVLPINSVTLDGSTSSSSGNITSYSWTKIAGPSLFNIVSPTSATTLVNNLVEGRYSFVLTVTDDNALTSTDTVNVIVSSRILIDIGPTIIASPDVDGKYWNTFTDGLPGVKLSNAITTGNASTTIGLEVINRIDGTFNPGGPGTNTGNTIGAVNDYGADATTDFAFAHPSATNGQWKITGLEATRQYTVKFWGTRSVPDERFIEIKRADQTVWLEYNASENSLYDNAAVFTFSGQTEMIFDIRVKTGSAFGHISLIDISRTAIPEQGYLPPVSNAGADITITLPGNSTTLNGTASSDPDGTIGSYQWRKIAGPASFNIVTPNAATTVVDNLVEGTYYFELEVTDNENATDVDTVIVTVGTRVLFDIGNTVTTSPDAGNKFWNNVTDGLPGVKVSNAISTGNTSTGINLEIINRIDGTFNLAGPGVNTGNTVGDVGDYPNSATTDFAFAHPSATNGQWKLGGLDITKEYTVKFWGARTAADQRIIEIKRNDQSVWQSYNATNNTDFNRAAVFTFTGVTEMVFDIRVESESAFGHISVVDVNVKVPTVVCNPVTPSVTVTANPSNVICDGTSVTFTASPVNGGATPQYQWKKNGIDIIGETNVSYTTNTLVNGDLITVQLTSSEECPTINPVLSDAITMTVNQLLPVSVSITANPGDIICDGTSVTFTASPVNGGLNPQYQWFNGANPIVGETAATFTSATLQNGDIITVQLISSETCTSGNPATSNGITMTVNPILPVSVSITANPGDIICDGTSVTFTATPVNGGLNPQYQWFNGANPIAGETGSTYTSATLQNGDIITVQLISSETCTSGNPATSNSITMTVNPILPVSVSITANPGDIICDGASVTFTATPVNGGLNPQYQWFNGTNAIAGETGSTYTSATLQNGDIITVQLISSETCTSGNPATSNGITMTVNPILPVSVSITANPGDIICDGTSVTFTASPVNGGLNPQYQWFNGANPIVGETAATYTSATLQNGDIITVQLISSETCTSGNPATSNGITMTVNPLLPVSVSISANPGDIICDGTSVTFTASPVNGGLNPQYQWFNGTNAIAGETGSTYTSATLQNGDIITVQLISSETCTSGNPATSNGITMTVNPILPVSVSISANPGDIICDGTSVTFTASPVNGGLNPQYQWFNGANPIVGETAATYTSATLQNGDIITVQLISSETCTSGNPATSNGITMTVNPLLPASVTIVAAPGDVICAGTSVTFTATPVNGGTAPTYQWLLNGIVLVGETNLTFTSSNLQQGDIVTVILKSNAEPCLTNNPATSNAITMTVNPPLPVSVSIVANPGDIVCEGTSVTFTATPVNGGSNPQYQWFNGANPIAGETAATYTSSSLLNGDQISVVLTSDITPCATGNPSTSNVISMTVNPFLPVSVDISASTGNIICDGTSVTFTATPANGGTNPQYQWFNGANPIAGETAATYTSSTLQNGAQISVQLNSSELCTTGNPANSNVITMTVNPNLPVSVSIAANPGNEICAGTLVSFTATPVNGGLNPSYQWFINGNAVAGETNTVFNTILLSNNDIVTVQLVSSETCTSGNPATSNGITMTVNPILPVSVTILANPGTTVCFGTPVTFTANPVNGGSSPTYQWYLNGVLLNGETNSTYVTADLVDRDEVYVVLTSSEICNSGNPATSDTLTMTILRNLQVSVTVDADLGTTICSGSTVTFTATPDNGGSSPVYQWFNGANPIAGQTGATYISSSIVDGDQISVSLTSDLSCAVGNPAVSNVLSMTVNPTLPLSVNINVSPGSEICEGTPVSFTAVPVNEGTTPLYQWYNGANPIVGETAATFSSSTLANGDLISLQVTSSEACAVPNPVFSNAIGMAVNPLLPVSVSIEANPGNVVCEGTPVTFTATAINGGNNPQYQWFNGANAIAGETASTYIHNNPLNGDVISVVLNSDANPCATGNPATSNSITLTVNQQLPVSVSIASGAGNSICAGTSVTFTATPVNGGANPQYQWFNGANPIAGETASTFTSNALQNGDQISVVLTSGLTDCTVNNPAASNTITMVVNPVQQVQVSISANPGNVICAGTLVTFTATPVNGGSNPQYQWFNGSNAIAGETAATYSSSTLQNGDVISVQLISDILCAVNPTATSNSITVTVNNNLPLSVSISANPGNVICEGSAVTFTATVVNGGSTPQYQWFNGSNQIAGETNSSFSTTGLQNGDAISVQVVSTEVCVVGSPGSSNTITMTVNQLLQPSISISANPGNTICSGASITFTANPVNGGTAPQYQWRKNNNDIIGEISAIYTATGLLSGDVISCSLISNETCAVAGAVFSNDIVVTVNEPSTSVTNITTCDNNYEWNGTVYTLSGTYTFTTINSVGCDSIATLNLTFGNQIDIGPLTGPTNACAYMGPNAQIATYSITAPLATSYFWRVPMSATILSGQGTNTITVRYFASFGSGSVIVTIGSPCSGPISRSILVTRSVPAVPAAINGPVTVCSFIGTGITATYSVNPVANALGYRWTLPAFMSIQSAAPDSSSITVLFDAGFLTSANKVLKVKTLSGCANSSDRSLTLIADVAATPSAISGPVNACLFIGSLNQATYSINPVANATGYNWSVPAGATIVDHPAGTAENDTVIVVSFDNNFISGTFVTVSSQSACGPSANASLQIVRIAPGTPVTIAGPIDVCPFISGSPDRAVYSISPVSNANAYNWTVPAGATVTHPNGSGVNDTIIEVVFPSDFISGNITVSSVNGCSSSPVKSLTVRKITPATPVITGPTDPCPLIGVTTATYTINKIAGATSYTWGIPDIGASATHPNGPGANDTVIVVTYTSAFISGNISVRANAFCANSSVRTLTIVRRLPSTPGLISTETINASCPVRRYSYFIAALPANSTGTQWTVPSGAVIDSGQGTLRIYVTYPSTAIVSGIVSVVGTNGCGSSVTSRRLTVNLAACPGFFVKQNIEEARIELMESQVEVKAMPNPSNYEFKISFTGGKVHEPITLRVIDWKGNLVETRKGIQSAQVINIGANYPRGIYIAEFTQGKLRKTIRLSKL